MSSAPHPHGPDGQKDHAFTGEPVRVLAPDEPRTPGWLPLVGIALFTGAAVFVLVGHDPETAKPDPVATAEAAKPASPPQPGPPPGAPPPPRFGPPTGPPAVATKLTAEQVEKLRKARDLVKAKGAPTQ